MLRAATEPAMPGDRSSRNRNESGRPNYGRDADKDKNRARFYTLPYRFSSSRCFRFPRMKSLSTENSSVAAQSDAQPVDASRSQWAAANAFVAIGPCVSRAFLFLRGSTDDRNSGCEHAWYMEAYNCQPQAGQGNIPNRPHSNPDVPFWVKNMRSGRATAQQAGMDFSSSFRPNRRVRFRLPRARKISLTEPARHELTNMLPAGKGGNRRRPSLRSDRARTESRVGGKTRLNY